MLISFLFSIFLIKINYLYSSRIKPLIKEKIGIKNFIKEKFFQKKRLLKKLEEYEEDIAIIHINDVHCGFNDTIGYDGFALYRNELKKKYKNIITIDVGDHVQGGTLGAISNGEAIIKIMNKIGFNISILGNHEFDYGIKQLIKFDKTITSRYTCANFCYHKNKSTIFEPYKIMEIGNKKIAFISVITPYTFYKSSLFNIKDSNGEPIYDFLSGNHTQELYDKIQKYINEVKLKGANYVIILSHLGMGGKEPYSSDLFLSKLEGIDIILDGHTHLVYNSILKDKNGNNVYITQAGTKLQSIGILILKKDGSIITKIINEVPIPNNKTGAKIIKRGKKKRWVDSEMNEFINNIWNDYKDELNINIGYSDFDLIISNGDAHTVICRIKECTIGDIATDAIKEVLNAEISIITGGSFRSNINKGNITRGDIINIMPFFNNIVVKKIKGKDILDALELGVSKLPNFSSGFLQVSGITFDVDIKVESPVKINEKGMLEGINGTRRVSNVKINGKNIELNKVYKVSFSDYLSNGGGGYMMFSKYEVFNESLITDTDAISLFIKNNLNSIISKKYKQPQSRINITGNNKYIQKNTFSINNSSENYFTKNYRKNLIFINIFLISLIF